MEVYEIEEETNLVKYVRSVLLMKDSDEAIFQEEFWEIKEKNNKKFLEAMNKDLVEEMGSDPSKLQIIHRVNIILNFTQLNNSKTRG